MFLDASRFQLTPTLRKCITRRARSTFCKRVFSLAIRFLKIISPPCSSPLLPTSAGREDGYSVSVLGNGFQVRVHPIEKYDFRRVAADAESIKNIANTGSVFYFDKVRFGTSPGGLQGQSGV